mmetsp:Transcript_11686/g.17147  ORF Transcript_11686/g.17147 Transcript_11686/m.17147 type:complete len:256 (+) Transcript_11686:367-1134(+)
MTMAMMLRKTKRSGTCLALKLPTTPSSTMGAKPLRVTVTSSPRTKSRRRYLRQSNISSSDFAQRTTATSTLCRDAVRTTESTPCRWRSTLSPFNSLWKKDARVCARTVKLVGTPMVTMEAVALTMLGTTLPPRMTLLRTMMPQTTTVNGNTMMKTKTTKTSKTKRTTTAKPATKTRAPTCTTNALSKKQETTTNKKRKSTWTSSWSAETLTLATTTATNTLSDLTVAATDTPFLLLCMAMRSATLTWMEWQSATL